MTRGERPLLLAHPAASLHRERGAIAPLLAVLIATLTVFSLWGANQVSLLGVRREQQKGADLGALAGAANIPLLGLFTSGEPHKTACDYADRLLATASSPLANNLTETRTGPKCIEKTVTVEALIEFPGYQWFLDKLKGLTDPQREAVRTALADLWPTADARIDEVRAALTALVDALEAQLGVTIEDNPDDDGDGVRDAADNCAAKGNSAQRDSDGDGIGDACDDVAPDADLDGDAVANASDNCVDTANPDQADADGDGSGDACDGVTLSLSPTDMCNPTTLANLAQTVDGEFFARLTDTDCASLRDALAGLPDNLSPATQNPLVHVWVGNKVKPPVPLPEFLNGATADGSWQVIATATARRRFKNLIVLPAAQLTDLCAATQQDPGTILPTLLPSLDPESLLAEPSPSPSPSPLPNPACKPINVCPAPLPADSPACGVPASLNEPINVNDELAVVRDALLPILWNANKTIGDAVEPWLPPEKSLYATLKAHEVLGPYVPTQADGAAAQLPPDNAFDLSQMIRDVRDLYDPPSGGAAPRPAQVAAEAAKKHEAVVLLRLFRMPVLGIPAFDFTAAYLDFSACTTDLTQQCFKATPIPIEQLSAATGLFGATLVS